MRRAINIILIILIIIAVFVLGYYLLQPEPESAAGLSPAGFTSSAGITSDAIRSQAFIDLLRDLKQTNIERSFFDTPTFQSLREFGRPLNSQPKGRSNPFAPFGTGNLSAGTASASVNIQPEGDTAERTPAVGTTAPVVGSGDAISDVAEPQTP